MTYKQRIIFEYLRNYKTITLNRAVELIGNGIYANKNRYVGMILSRMVRNNLIKRVKPGLFESIASEKNLELFNE